MKTRIIRLTTLIAILSMLVYVSWPSLTAANTVRAVGDITVDWGVPEGNPLFSITNMAPGEKIVRQVIVTNGASTAKPLGVRGLKTTETGNLANVLTITIADGGTYIYGMGSPTGPKTLAQFFTDSASSDGISLLTLNPSASKTLIFEVTFDSHAGNEYQNRTLIFDIFLGVSVQIPQACMGIKFAGNPIFGTQGNDRINGTNGNDLIFGFEGNDRIDGSNGNDCIVGGLGNDLIDASNGHDQLFGNEGNDRIDGSNGNDYIDAGDGDDNVDGSNGDDQIYGKTGNDRLDGGNDKDLIYGEDGSDTLIGGMGNDLLDGGLQTDKANGELGKDTCVAETKSNCEL